jgi:F-actin capping protein alpha subunit
MYLPPINFAYDAQLTGLLVSQVQLETKNQSSIALPTSITASSPGPSAKKVLTLIADEEGAYQASLGDTYHEMGEKAFKGLRRALPLTRQKLDWDKVRRSLPSESLGVSLTLSLCRCWGINSVRSCLPVKASSVGPGDLHEWSRKYVIH